MSGKTVILAVLVVILGAAAAWSVTHTTNKDHPNRSAEALAECHDLVRETHPGGELEGPDQALQTRTSDDVYEVNGTLDGHQYRCVMHPDADDRAVWVLDSYEPPEGASMTPAGISAEVVRAVEVTDASGSQRLALEILVRNDSSDRILGDLPSISQGEATLTQNGIEVAHQSLADFSGNRSTTGPIDPGTSQCWTQSYPEVALADTTTAVMVTIPTASLAHPTGGQAQTGRLSIWFDPSMIRTLSAADFDVSSSADECG